MTKVVHRRILRDKLGDLAACGRNLPRFTDRAMGFWESIRGGTKVTCKRCLRWKP